MEDERGIEVHDQSFARRDAGGFLEFLRTDRQLVVHFEWIDQVNAFWQFFACDPAE